MSLRHFAAHSALSLSLVSTLACTANIVGDEQHRGAAAAGTAGSTGAAAGGQAAGATGSGSGGTSSVVQGGPGRVVMHRLNRLEYDNTVGDLLGTELRLSENFPPDDTAYGFDNVASALNMTDVALGYYISTAKQLAAEALSPERRANLVSCDLVAEPQACVTTVLQTLLPRAWRRPAEAGEVERLVALFTSNKADGASDDEALGRVLQAVLLAPEFLFRVERNSGVAGTRALNGFELASRLSYFLWSSMPDAELTSAAAAGLNDPAALATQVTRMLADGKASVFADSFGSQWLTLRSLDTVRPDASVYPDFDDELRRSMRVEATRFFADIVAGQRSLGELITSRSGYVDDRLARHYGMAPVGSTTPVFTLLPPERRGLLTQASILTVQAHPKESAPVLRGKWILSQLLCQELPPPPPDVPQEPAAQAGQSRRERLAAHRSQPVCKSCHQQMDPLGLSLENFDGVGAYRTTDSGVAIDPSGELPDGRKWTNPQELAEIVARDPALPRCLAQHLFTYAVGRAPRPDNDFDAATLERTSATFSDAGQRLPPLVAALVLSDAFRQREDEVAP